MTKPVKLRAIASADVDSALEHYLNAGDAVLAMQFIDALERSLLDIGDNPLAGSMRYSYELDIPDLRCRTLRRFPYLLFYVERAGYVDVWRLLHARRDIPPSLLEPSSD